MKRIKLTIELNDDLGIVGVTIDENDTDLPSDHGLIKNISYTLLESISLNKDYLKFQDEINDLEI